MLYSPILAGSSSNNWTLTLSADEANVNLKTKLEGVYGTMVSKVTATVTIAAGVEIYSASPGTAALDTGTGWPSGSSLTIVNEGHIYGAGGVGASFNGAGSVGGDAITLRMATRINNTLGQIFSGGGGGGASGTLEHRLGWTGSFWYYWNEGDPLNDPPAHAYGAGGGGRGRNGGVGGTGDTGHGASNGANGSPSAPGSGSGGVDNGLSGGAGGDWGSTGSAGGNNGFSDPTWDHSEAGAGKHWRVSGREYGSNGYAAGCAVRRNGNSVTWLGGYNGTQVKGAVS